MNKMGLTFDGNFLIANSSLELRLKKSPVSPFVPAIALPDALVTGAWEDLAHLSSWVKNRFESSGLQKFLMYHGLKKVFKYGGFKRFSRRMLRLCNPSGEYAEEF